MVTIFFLKILKMAIVLPIHLLLLSRISRFWYMYRSNSVESVPAARQKIVENANFVQTNRSMVDQGS